jgi:hypothetical protein
VKALAFFLAELAMVLAGLGLAGCLRPSRAVSRLEIFGLSLLLGAGALSVILFVASQWLRGFALLATTATIALGLGVSGWRQLRAAQWEALPGSRALLAALVPLLVIIGWQATNHPLTADGLFNFEIRAQIAAAHGGHLPHAFFSDASRVWMHQSYPLFLPSLQTWIYLVLGGVEQGWGQLLSLHFVAAAAILLYAGITRLTGAAGRGGVAVGLLLLLPTAMFLPGGATSLWADFPLAVVFLAAVLAIAEFAAHSRGLALCAVWLALLPWVKREGLVLAAVLGLALLCIGWRRRSWRATAFALLPLLGVVVGWRIFLTAVHASGDRDFLPLSLATALGNLDRLPLIALALGRELLTWERWSLLWPAALLAFLRIARAPALVAWRWLAPVSALLLAIYSGIYLLSAWENYALHIVTSLPRLLLPVAMAALIGVAVAVPGWGGEK